MTLGVTMTTWNGANSFIRESLESVLPYCAQVVVADEGSVDETPELLKELQKKYPQLEVLTSEIKYPEKYAEERRIVTERNTRLSQAYQTTRDMMTTDWIMKVDDDEIFPPELMKEIQGLNGIHEVYALRFLHFETWDTVLDPAFHQNLFMGRLFRNLPKYHWSGDFGNRVITAGASKVSSARCPKLKNPFLHLGNLRLDKRHGYIFNKRPKRTIPLPKKYYEYLPKH